MLQAERLLWAQRRKMFAANRGAVVSCFFSPVSINGVAHFEFYRASGDILATLDYTAFIHARMVAQRVVA